MKFQDGNAPGVHDVRIDFAVAVFVRNHFAAAGEADEGAVKLAPAAPTVSIKYLPTKPEEFARPFGCRGLLELSSSRADSQALAASTTTLPRTWTSLRVFLSM